MIRNLKVLAPIMVVTLATSALLASAAQGVGNHTATLLHGEQYGTGAENYFEAFGSKTSCTNSGVTFVSADANGTATELTITPTYKDCNVGGLSATVTMNGCDYFFTEPTAIEGSLKYTGKADLTCPTGKKVQIEVYLFGGVTSHFGGMVCLMEVGPKGGAHQQELGGHVIYSAGEAGGRDDLTVKAEVSGITASRSGSGCATEETNAGIYKSTVTLTAESEKEELHDLWISEEAGVGQFTAGRTPVGSHTATVLHGEQYGAEAESYFEAFGQNTTCTNSGVTLVGADANGTATELTITPTYKDCKASGLPATVTMNGCDYVFTHPTAIVGSLKYTGKVDLTCPTGKKAQIEVYLFGGVTSHFGGIVCTLEVGPKGGAHQQELGGHVIYSAGEAGGRDDLTVKAEVSGITASRSGSGCATEETNAGIYKSTVTLTAEDEKGEPHDLWISEEAGVGQFTAGRTPEESRATDTG